MRYVIRTFVAMTLFAFCWVVVGYGVNQLLQIGTCASGGPYVSARQCPDGIGGLMLGLTGGVLLLFVAAGIYLTRGKPPGGGEPQGAAVVIWFWTGLFWSLAAGSLLAVWGPDANPGPGGKAGGLIVGFMGLIMGAGGLLSLSLRTRGAAIGVGPVGPAFARMAATASQFATPAPAASVDRLAVIDSMRREGTLSDSEFEDLKAKILRAGG